MLSLLLACGSSPSPAPLTVDDSAAEALCDVGLSVSPIPGTAEHFYRDPIVISFTADPGEVTADLSTEEGLIESTLSLTDSVATLTPTAPLSPDTSYTLGVDYCGGTISLRFSTSSIGHPVSPAAIIGQTWVLDLMSGEFIKPEASGVVTAFTLGDGYLFSVLSADQTTVSLRGGRAIYDGAWRQELCAPTIDLDAPLNFTDNPLATLQGNPITIGWMDMMEGSLSGAFSDDGTTVAHIQLSGSITVTDLLQTIADQSLSKAEACGLLEGFGLDCTACPDGSGPYCITYALVGITAPTSAPLVQRTKAEVALDPECLGQ